MTSHSPVICLEFNELVPSLMDKFIAAGELPNFQRLRDQSIVQVSDAQAEGEWLNPWVQWVTVHSGLSPQEHGVFRLSDAHQLKTPAIWDVVSAAGKNVWVCGSMNPWYQDNLRGHVLPDPWCQQVEPYPQGEFEPFYSFVQRNVQEYAAAKIPLTKRDILNFVSFLATHGLKVDTAFKIVGQLTRERLGNHRWRRASILDRVQYDIFAWYYRKYRPAFSTFFINSTAHYQHRFWRNMEPEHFAIKPTAAEQRDYGDAILFGYRQMDAIVGRVLDLDPQATIMLLTGLGQQPYTKMESTGGKRVFRLHGASVLAEKLGVPGTFSYEPIMADEFFLRFDDAAVARAAAERLRSFRLPGGKEAFTAEEKGNDLVCQCRCRELPAHDAVITVSETGETVPFADVFYRVDCLKSGYHHPDGIWWIRLPHREHRVVERKVPLTSVAPTVLHLLGIESPEFMSAGSCLSDSTDTDKTPVGQSPVIAN